MLNDLMLAARTDKASTLNGYAQVYERYLGAWRDRAFRLLEIGVGRGRSLNVWEHYFPGAQFVGLDIDPSCQRLNRERVTIHTGHQRDGRLLRSLGSFDVVIDDGSHVWKDQIGTFRMLFWRVNPGGLYFVEDVQTSYWPEYASPGPTAVQYFTRLVDDLNINGRLRHSNLENCSPTKVGALKHYEGMIEFISFYPGLIVIGRSERGVNRG